MLADKLYAKHRFPLQYNSFHIFYFDKLKSTNDFLKENEFDNNTVILCKKQTNGRGRNDHLWISNNDLTFSIVIKDIKYNQRTISAISLIETLKTFGISAKIKWPNDIYVNKKKLAGILIEDIYSGNKFKYSIIGVGINFDYKIKYDNYYIKICKLKFLNVFLEKYKYFINACEDIINNKYKLYNLVFNKYIEYKGVKIKIIDFTNAGEMIGLFHNKKTIIYQDEISIKKFLF